MPLALEAILKDRAILLARARTFFQEREVMEVDCPLLTKAASIDAHIDLIPALYTSSEKRYLHSSPEYGMKRLLAEGIGDIYQLSHVFRDGELGNQHNPEFMMAEWYRLGLSFTEMIGETFDFVRLFVGDLPHTTLTYREAFQRFADFDYVSISEEELIDYLKAREITPHQYDKEALLNLVLGLIIEPHLGQQGLCALTHYPESQAALAQTCFHGEEEVAERFEVYYKGVELANGYHELSDASEQRRRFTEANAARSALGKETLPIDEPFLEALDALPDCCGVAVGFDRLMMLRHNTKEITNVIPFGWHTA